MSQGQQSSQKNIYLTETSSSSDGSKVYMIGYSSMGKVQYLDTFQVAVHHHWLQITQKVKYPSKQITSKLATCQLRKMMLSQSKDLMILTSLLRSGAKLIWLSNSKKEESCGTPAKPSCTISRAQVAYINQDFLPLTGGKTSSTSKESGKVNGRRKA